MFDAQEQQLYPWIQKRSIDKNPDPNAPLDPDGDDWYYTTGSTDYTHVNGTENNSGSQNGKFPDTEDLLHNGNLNTINNYFEYNVKLDTVKNPYIAGGGSKGWYRYIIPLKDPSKTVGSPSLSAVQFVRFWFDGMTAGSMLVDIAQMDLLGNYWQVPNINDSTMQVSVVDFFDTPGYQPPVAGLQPVDNSDPTQSVLENESSLDLILTRLHGGDSRYAYKTFPNTLNLFHYKTMKFFVHGDPTFNYVDSTHHDADVYIRFGSDSSNFYEYRQPILDQQHLINTGLKPGWQDLAIDFSKLTAIKQNRDSVNQPYTQRVSAGNGVPGATYWVQGNPSLMSVTYFQIGITNPKPGSAKLLSGSVWIDELRLTNVDNTPGVAYRFDGSIQLADIGQVAFNFSKTDPYFHDLTTQFGTLNTQQNWSVSTSLSLDKLLPREWQGTTIPFTYTHSESFANPLYLPGSDILITSAMQSEEDHLTSPSKGYTPAQAAAMADSLRASSQTLNITNSWAIPTVRIVIPSTKWYIKDILDDITMGYNWSGSDYNNTQVKTGNNWQWNYTAGYSVQFDPNAYLTPFPSKSKSLSLSQPAAASIGNAAASTGNAAASTGDDFQIRYLPNSLNFSMSAQRSLAVEDYWADTTERITPNFTATRGGGINWKFTNNGILNPTLDYRFSINSSLLAVDYDTSTGKPYPNSYVFHQIFLNNGLINFGNDYNFSQQFQLTTQPKPPFNIERYLDLQGSYSSGYSWNNSLQQAQYGRTSSVNSSLSLGSSLRLKMLADTWFTGGASVAATQDTSRSAIQQPPPFNAHGRGHGREEFENIDTTSTITVQGKRSPLGNLLGVLVKAPFLDFDNISVNFTSTNSSQNGGLPSNRPGMSNFFRVPFVQESDPALGPSQLYQLGLISDPYSKLNLVKRNGFPFFGFDETPTVRIPNAGITDNFSNTNSLDFKTSRNLWQGARIDLSWHVGWNYNRNSTYTTDANGNPIDSTMTTMISGQVTRSFFTIPPVSVFSLFKSGLNQVIADYQSMENLDPNDLQSTPAQKLSQAFVKGFETLPFLDKIFGQYMPRMNYSFHWDGLEQIPLFKSFATHVSLDNAYQSTYQQSWHIQSGLPGQVTDAQTISYGFQPLLGLNIAFKNIGDAVISGSIQYNTSSQYSSSPSSLTIAQQNTNQLSITANYSKKGFAIPLFGLNLQNDVDISASYSSALSNSYSFSTNNLSAGAAPLPGTNQTTLKIQFQYSISQRVTASIYYSNTKVAPTTPGSPIPGTTTNEAGVDVHVSIAGQ
jgi:cell surface protein SprA